MAGIPVHTSSPINPHAPPNALTGSSSSSAARYTPVDATPSPTTADNGSSTTTPPPPPPQPSAPTVPQPTSPPRLTDSPSPRTLPAQIARLPPRQTYASPPTLSKLSIPNSTSFSSPYTAPPGQYQHQRHTSLQTPLRHKPPHSATHSFHAPPTPYQYHHNTPTSATSTKQDLSNPPGYMQARSSFDDRSSTECASPNTRAFYTNSSRLSILDGHYSLEPRPEEDPLSASSQWVWDTAVKWTKVAGQTLKEGEREAWKRVQGDV